MSRTALFDSHAHMDSDYFTDDRDALLTQLQEELDGIINPGCDEITSGFAVSLADIPMIPRNTKQMMNINLFILILFVCCYDVEYDQLIELELLQLDRVALVASV